MREHIGELVDVGGRADAVEVGELPQHLDDRGRLVAAEVLHQEPFGPRCECSPPTAGAGIGGVGQSLDER